MQPACGSNLHCYVCSTAVIGGVWSVVGSSNLDWRSVVFYNEIDNEIDAVVLGPTFGSEMEVQFRQDIAASVEITPEIWAHRGIGERWMNSGRGWLKVSCRQVADGLRPYLLASGAARAFSV
jgi:hypothetical protein